MAVYLFISAFCYPFEIHQHGGIQSHYQVEARNNLIMVEIELYHGSHGSHGPVFAATVLGKLK